MFKRLLCLTISVLLIFSLTITGFAEKPITVTVNGKKVVFDVPPAVIKGATMVPVKATFEALGATVEWIAKEKRIIGKKGNIRIELQINNKTAKINGKNTKLDVPATLVKGRTLVPIRFIAQSFGAKVEWVSKTRTAVITYSEKGSAEESTDDSKTETNTDSSKTDTSADNSKYTKSGNLTTITDELFKDVDKQLNIQQKELSDIKKVFDWKNANFKSVSDGGKGIGKTTVNDIIQRKELAGCHDHAVLCAAILRKYGFPVIMADTIGIQFSLDYPEKTQMFSGHVFLEVYIQNKWILLDPVSSEYIADYDPNNPVIPITKSVESKGYYVMLKGIDPNDYGIYSLTSLTDKMKRYSNTIKSTYSQIQFPSYKISRL